MLQLEARDVPNSAPIAGNDYFSVHQGKTLDILAPGVLANDSDPDGNTMTVSGVQGPSHAALFSLLSGGRLQYRPAPGFVGQDALSYEVSDGKGGTAQVVVTIDVTNTAPVYSNGTIQFVTAKDQTISIPAPAGSHELIHTINLMAHAGEGLPSRRFNNELTDTRRLDTNQESRAHSDL